MPSRDIIDDVHPAQGIRIAPQRTSRYVTAEVFLKRLFAGKSGFVARKRRQKSPDFLRVTLHAVNPRNIRFADTVDVGSGYTHCIDSRLANRLRPTTTT